MICQPVHLLSPLCQLWRHSICQRKEVRGVFSGVAVVCAEHVAENHLPRNECAGPLASMPKTHVSVGSTLWKVLKIKSDCFQYLIICINGFLFENDWNDNRVYIRYGQVFIQKLAKGIKSKFIFYLRARFKRKWKKSKHFCKQ